jgi:hypothetical protein
LDVAQYTYEPAITLWKLAGSIVGVGVAALVITAEQLFLLNRTRKLFGIVSFLLTTSFFFLPVRAGVFGDFQFVSSMYVFANLPALIIWIIFLWLLIICPGLRRGTSYLFIGFSFYIVFSLLLNANILGAISVTYGIWLYNLLYAVIAGSKVVGLVLVTIGFTHFKEINKGLIDYYGSKRVCIVHRGKIKGKSFMCSKCHLLYCMACKDAVMKLGNKCWNCGSALDQSLHVDIQLFTSDPLFDKFQEIKTKLKLEDSTEVFKQMIVLATTALEQKEKAASEKIVEEPAKKVLISQK